MRLVAHCCHLRIARDLSCQLTFCGQMQDKPQETEKIMKPRKQAVLLEDMAGATITKPTTDFGARQETAKKLMLQAQHKISQNKHGEAADLYAHAEELFGTFNDIDSQQDAATKKQTALYQAQMEQKAAEAKRKTARVSINQGLHAMNNNDDAGALNHFSSAEQSLGEMKDTDQEVLIEIRRHKDQAAAKIAQKTQVKLSALQHGSQQLEDLTKDREQQLREKEANMRKHEVQARKHELAARRLQASVAAPSNGTSASGGVVGGGGSSSPPGGGACPGVGSAQSRMAELEAMKEKRRMEQEKKVGEQRKNDDIHRKLYQTSVTNQLASALGLPTDKLAADPALVSECEVDTQSSMQGGRGGQSGRQLGVRYDPTATEPTSATGRHVQEEVKKEQERKMELMHEEARMHEKQLEIEELKQQQQQYQQQPVQQQQQASQDRLVSSSSK